MTKVEKNVAFGTKNDQMLATWLMDQDSPLSIAKPTVEAFRRWQDETAEPEHSNSDFMYGYLRAMAVILCGLYGPMSPQQQESVTHVLKELLTWASMRRAVFDLSTVEGSDAKN